MDTHEYLKQTTEDLVWVSDALTPDPLESTLRQLSGTLRRLLVDRGGSLQHARKLRGVLGEPELLGVDLRVTLAALDVPLNAVLLATAGPHKLAAYGSRAMGSMILTSQPFAQPAGVQDWVRLPLTRYLDAPGLRLRHPDDDAGRFISRRTVLTYIANKRGGVHYDSTRNKKGDEEYEYLDASIAFASDIDGYPPHYLVLLSIAQALVTTAGVMEPFGLQARNL